MTQLSTSRIPGGFTEKTARVNGVTLNFEAPQIDESLYQFPSVTRQVPASGTSAFSCSATNCPGA